MLAVNGGDYQGSVGKGCYRMGRRWGGPIHQFVVFWNAGPVPLCLFAMFITVCCEWLACVGSVFSVQLPLELAESYSWVKRIRWRQEQSLQTPLQYLPGMGPIRAQRFSRLGLLMSGCNLPVSRDYEYPAAASKIDDLQEGSRRLWLAR